MDLRAFIKKVISESFQPLDEAQKGKQFDAYVEVALSNISPFIDPLSTAGLNMSEVNLNETAIMKEVSLSLIHI